MHKEAEFFKTLRKLACQWISDSRKNIHPPYASALERCATELFAAIAKEKENRERVGWATFYEEYDR